MDKQIVLFGSGCNGKDALNYFGKSAVFCFVDNDIEKDGKFIQGKKIFSLEKFEEMYNQNRVFYEIFLEIVITVSKTPWMMFSIANQLKKMNINNFSIYKDVRKRWEKSEDFINRNRDIYPCEQESILEIYKRQLNYMLRHTNPLKMLPATGELREIQLKKLDLLNEFFIRIEKLDIKPFMVAGTLLGAVRHEGYIPWDDDLDFALLSDEFNLLISYLKQNSKIFYHVGSNIWKSKEGEYNCSSQKYPYIVASGFGYIQIYYNSEQLSIKDNLCLCDIFQLYYIDNSVSEEMYAKECIKWTQRRKKNYEEVDKVYNNEVLKQNIIAKSSNYCGYGFDLISALNYWHGANGKNYNNSIWKIENLLPLKKMKFEAYQWWAPIHEIEWLKQEENDNPLKLPSRVGVWVHDKDKFFSSVY